MKYTVEGYKILPLHVPNRFYLRKYEHLKSQFWNSHLGVLGKKCHLDVDARKVIEYNIGRGVVPPPYRTTYLQFTIIVIFV
jgi:hypothetical protein